MIEVDEIRNMAIKLHGFDKVDENYTFYYDETNNIGRLLIKPNGLNIQDPKCYVLGGIAHKGSWHQPSIAQMKSKLRIQESAAEIKLKNLARGNFIELLASRKIAVFLNWLLSEEIYIHYQALDIIYWSVVDIVDSILAELQQSQLFDYVFIFNLNAAVGRRDRPLGAVWPVDFGVDFSRLGRSWGAAARVDDLVRGRGGIS